MFTKTIIFVVICSLIYSEWRWANDTIEFTMDKEAHFAGSAGAYFFFRHKDYTINESIKYTFYLGLTKEFIDAILPYEKYGRWGGDGFSKYDLYYDVLGIGAAVLIDKWWKPKEGSKWERRFNTNSVSVYYRLD